MNERRHFNKISDYWPTIMNKQQYENAIKYKDELVKKFGKRRVNDAIFYYEALNKQRKQSNETY